MTPGELTHQPLTAVVFGMRYGSSDTNVWRELESDLRLAKAGYLYADKLELASSATGTVVQACNSATALVTTSHGRDPHDLELTGAVMTSIASLLRPEDHAVLSDLVTGVNAGALRARNAFEAGMLTGFLSSGHVDRNTIPLLGPDFYKSVVDDPIGKATDEHLQWMLETLEKLLVTTHDEKTLGFYGSLADHVRQQLRLPLEQRTDHGAVTPPKESLLVSELLGTLPGFPDAAWDVLTDVHNRLEDSRIRLRASILEAAAGLADIQPEEVAQACASVRTRVVEPALLDMEEALRELDAFPTLLRLSADAASIGGVVANLALFAGSPETLGASALLHGAASAPMLAAAAKETARRRSIRQTVSSQPFWALREFVGSAPPRRRRSRGRSALDR